MKITIQILVEDETTPEAATPTTLSFERHHEALRPETLGLKLDEAKTILAEVQTALVRAQAMQELSRHCDCPECGRPYPKNGTHQLTFRTLFGTVKLASQRFSVCSCPQARMQRRGQKCLSFSPLAQCLPERTAPEFAYLQTKWAAIMSYGRAASLLEEVLPLEKRISTAVLSRQVQRVATRIDGELGEEQWAFIEGCQHEWEALPEPAEPIIMGIDGGYIHGREGENRKAGSFEIIVGKSMTAEQPPKRFGFVNTYDTKSKRRVYEVLKAQGMQMNQQVIFLSDGGDDVRNLQLYLNPQAEYVLDWFHITMRLTVLGQLAKGVVHNAEGESVKQAQPEPEEEDLSPVVPTLEELECSLERIKWYLWHGNTFRASQIGEDLEEDLDVLEERDVSIQKLLQAVREFNRYITLNEQYIVNYGDRYRNGETISTAFVESTVNEVISKRFVKRQQMRWTKRGAHHLLQVRIQVLNGDFKQLFCKWYHDMDEEALLAENEKAA